MTQPGFDCLRTVRSRKTRRPTSISSTSTKFPLRATVVSLLPTRTATTAYQSAKDSSPTSTGSTKTDPTTNGHRVTTRSANNSVAKNVNSATPRSARSTRNNKDNGRSGSDSSVPRQVRVARPKRGTELGKRGKAPTTGSGQASGVTTHPLRNHNRLRGRCGAPDDKALCLRGAGQAKEGRAAGAQTKNSRRAKGAPAEPIAVAVKSGSKTRSSTAHSQAGRVSGLNLGNSVTPKSVSVAVALLPSRISEDKSNKTRHVRSTCARKDSNENAPAPTPEVSIIGVATTSDLTTNTTTLATTTTKTAEENAGSRSDVDKKGRRALKRKRAGGVGGAPNKQCLRETRQKVSERKERENERERGGSVGSSLDGEESRGLNLTPADPTTAAAARPKEEEEGVEGSRISESILNSEQQQQQQQQLAMTKREEGEEEGKEREEEGKEREEVSDSLTATPTPSLSLLDPPLQKCEASLTTGTTIGTAATIFTASPTTSITTPTSTVDTTTTTTTAEQCVQEGKTCGKSAGSVCVEDNDGSQTQLVTDLKSRDPDTLVPHVSVGTSTKDTFLVPLPSSKPSTVSPETSSFSSSSLTKTTASFSSPSSSSSSFSSVTTKTTSSSSSSSSSSPSSSSPSSSAVGSFDQRLTQAPITSPKLAEDCEVNDDDDHCLKVAGAAISPPPPPTPSFPTPNKTESDAKHGFRPMLTKALTSNHFDILLVHQGKPHSTADTMCGPHEDKIMTNSSTLETSRSTTTEQVSMGGSASNNKSTGTLSTTETPAAMSPDSSFDVTGDQPVPPQSDKSTAALTAAIGTAATATVANFTSYAYVKNPTSNMESVLKDKKLSSSDNTPLAAVYTHSAHKSSSSPPPASLPSLPSSSPPSSLPPSSPPSTSTVLLNEDCKLKNTISALRESLLKGPYVVPDAKILGRTVSVTSSEGLAVVESNQTVSDKRAGSQSSFEPLDSFMAPSQMGEPKEGTEDSNSNNSSRVGAVGSPLSPNKDLDCALKKSLLQHQNPETEDSLDIKYENATKPFQNLSYADGTFKSASKDFSFRSDVYRDIYGYNCTFSVQKNKDMDHLYGDSGKKSDDSGKVFVNDLLRCMTAIADDHSYCWSVSKSQDTESLLRDAHPCDDEFSDSSSLDDIPDQQESLSLLSQGLSQGGSNASRLKHQKPKTMLSLVRGERPRKTSNKSSASAPSSSLLNPTSSKFMVDLPSSERGEPTPRGYRSFDQQKLHDHSRKINGLQTPVKFFDNSMTLTSPKITPMKGSGSSLSNRGSLQASPKIGRFRIGTYGSISNMDWEDGSPETSSSIGSISMSDKPKEKFTYCRKVDFVDKSDVPKLSFGEQYHRGDPGSRKRDPRENVRSNPVDLSAMISHIQHDHDYCMRTTISPLKSELAKELLSENKYTYGFSKFSHGTSPKASRSSSNSCSFSSSSSSSSSPRSTASYSRIPTPTSGVEAKSVPKNRNSSTSSRFVADASEPSPESPLKPDDDKLSEPANCDAAATARTKESKLKITGSFQNDYVYFLNKTTRSRRRFSHEILPDKNLQVRNYSDIVIPHLTDADIEALKQKQNPPPLRKASQDKELEADSRLLNSVLNCPEANPENLLPGLVDSTVALDTLATNPEQYLTPEEMDILFNAVKEVESTNFKALGDIHSSADAYSEDMSQQLNPALMLHEDPMNTCLTDVADPKGSPSDKAGTPVQPWSGCHSDLTKSEVLNTDNTLFSLENIPMGDINPMMGSTTTDRFKGSSLGCSAGSDLPPSDLSTLCANPSNANLSDEPIPALYKLDLLKLDKSDLFPEPAATETPPPVSEGNAPWIVTVTMFWNDLPAIMMDNHPFIRLVDLHKQILPAKDTGILKKRCQLLNLEVRNCTEFQRYFLVQYGRAYNSKSTLVISKDNAKVLIEYYVNPPARLPKGDEEPLSPGAKRITPKTNGSTMEGRIKKHGRLIGPRKQSLHKARNAERRLNKHKWKVNKPENNSEPPPIVEEQQEPTLASAARISSHPGQLKMKRSKKERHALSSSSSSSSSSSVNGKSRLRHKKINFLNLIRGETSTTPSSSTSLSPLNSANSTSSDPFPSSSDVSVLGYVGCIGDYEGEESVSDFSKPSKSFQELQYKSPGSKTRGVAHKQGVVTLSEEGEDTDEDLKTTLGAVENGKLKHCNGRVGLAVGGRSGLGGGNESRKKHPASAPSKWKTPRNGHTLGIRKKASFLKLKTKQRSVGNSNHLYTDKELCDNSATHSVGNKIKSLSQALLVFHSDAGTPDEKKHNVQPGKLLLGLYTTKTAKCIKCTTCAKVFSVGEFLQHQHLNTYYYSKLVSVSSSQSLHLQDDTNEKHRLLWKRFLSKRKQFETLSAESSKSRRTLGETSRPKASESASKKKHASETLTGNQPSSDGGNKKNSPTFRVSSRKRKQKQFYPIENYDFLSSTGQGPKDSLVDPNGGPWPAGRGRGANRFSPLKKTSKLSASSYNNRYASNVTSSNSSGGASGCKNVVTLTNQPELLNFTALEDHDDDM